MILFNIILYYIVLYYIILYYIILYYILLYILLYYIILYYIILYYIILYYIILYCIIVYVLYILLIHINSCNHEVATTERERDPKSDSDWFIFTPVSRLLASSHFQHSSFWAIIQSFSGGVPFRSSLSQWQTKNRSVLLASAAPKSFSVPTSLSHIQSQFHLNSSAHRLRR